MPMNILSFLFAVATGAGAISNCAGKTPAAARQGTPGSSWDEPGRPPPRQARIVPPPLPGEALGRHGRDLGRCRVFPPTARGTGRLRLPVDPHSDRYLRAMNADRKRLHPDFGSIPLWHPMDRRGLLHSRAEMKFKYDEESDPGPYPFPEDAPVEGGPDADGDRHVIAIDCDECKLYEAFSCWWNAPAWACESGAVFDLRSNKLRPEGWTSADAGGLPVFAGLVRRDEVTAGEIKHALRFTVSQDPAGLRAPRHPILPVPTATPTCRRWGCACA